MAFTMVAAAEVQNDLGTGLAVILGCKEVCPFLLSSVWSRVGNLSGNGLKQMGLGVDARGVILDL